MVLRNTGGKVLDTDTQIGGETRRERAARFTQVPACFTGVHGARRRLTHKHLHALGKSSKRTKRRTRDKVARGLNQRDPSPCVLIGQAPAPGLCPQIPPEPRLRRAA